MTIPFTDRLDTTIELRGRKLAVRWEFDCHRAGECDGEDDAAARGGWIDGTVMVDGREIAAGGGWVDADGTVTHYARGECGQLDELAEALGVPPASPSSEQEGELPDDQAAAEAMDAAHDAAMDELYEELSAGVPDTWAEVEAEVLAEVEDEWSTSQVIRIGDDYYHRVLNGGTRGAHSTGGNRFPVTLGQVEELTEAQAKRQMLQFGLAPAEIARKLGA